MLNIKKININIKNNTNLHDYKIKCKLTVSDNLVTSEW